MVAVEPALAVIVKDVGVFASKVMLGGFGPEVITPPETVTMMEVGASVLAPKGGWAVMTQVPSGTNRL